MDRPLSSLKVLDLTTLLPGPFATMILADLGAEVLRVEAPGRPDPIASMPPIDNGVSVWHALLNRNKRSLLLDLKANGAADLFKRLVGVYDIVVEQFRPGVMARLGLDYDALRRVNPRLIYCSITGYGQTGPYRERAGHDNNYLALAGVMSHTGRLESGPPGMGVQVADIGGGSFGAIVGILAAVVQRQITGAGQAIDVSMFDMAVAWNGIAFAYCLAGVQPDYESMPLNGGTYYDYYRTRDGRYLSVGSLERKFWEGFCEAIGRSDLADRGDGSDPSAQKQVKAEIAGALAQKDLAEWAAIFSERDVCVEPVLTAQETLSHPQTVARGLVVEVPRLDGTSQKQIASPIRFSASFPDYERIGPPPGAHTDEVLAEIGLSEGEIGDLRRRGVLASQPKTRRI